MFCMTKVVKTKAENVTEMVISQEVTPNLNWMKQTGVASVEEVQKLRNVIESGVSGGDTITAALNAHISNTNNPHEVTPGKIGAAPSSLTETVAALDLKLTNQISTHIDNKDNPHEVTPGKIGAAAAEHTHTAQEVTGILTEEMLLAHTEDTDNPHNVTTTQIGAVAQTAFDGLNQTVTNHISDLNNPHGVTTTQIGAATKNEVDSIKTDLAAHTGNNDNPHGTTAAQIGAPTTEEFDLLEEQVITHTEDTNNPHNVTHEQTGAAPLEHTHKVADITDKENLVQYSTFAETRKTIQLANYDSISGLTTAGVDANLVMLSKWNKADFGSPVVTMNLNTLDVVTINNDKEIATTDQIPDVSNLVTKAEIESMVTEDNLDTVLDEKIQTINITSSQVSDLTTTITNTKVNAAAIADTASNVTWENVNNKPESYTPSVHADNHGLGGSDPINIDASQIVSGKISVDRIPAVALPDLVEVEHDSERFALTSEDVQNGDHVKVRENSKLYLVIDATKLNSEDGYVEYNAQVDWVSITNKPSEFTPSAHTHSFTDLTNKDDVVTYSHFLDDPERRAIQLKNHDVISGIMTDGDGANLVMLSKWNKADFGSPKVTMNLNTIDNVTINDDKIIATTDQIPDISSLATKESLSSYVTTETAEATYRKNNVNLTTSDITNFTSEVAKIKVNSATSADMASSVAWENVQNAPTALPNPNALTIKYNGVQAFTYDGSKAETGNFTVTAETVPGVAKATDLELYRKKSDVLTSADISDFTSVVTSTKVDAAQVADVANSVSWDDVTGKPDMVITAAGNVQALADRLDLVETQLTDLKKTNVVPVVIDSESELNQPTADMVITAAETPVEDAVSIVAKSIDVKSMNATNAVVSMTATNDVTVQSLSLTGDLPKATSNAQVKINTSEYVKITKSSFAQTGYNAVEIGLQTAPKNVIIDGLDFTAPLSNNAILIFQHQDDAVITISNCHFAEVSNAVRISNKLNKRATVNIINCTVDKWGARSEWAGFLIMQDYTSGSVEAEETNNLFAPDKLTINFINVVGPDGKVIKPTNLAEVCGTSDENQIIYVWNSKGGTIPYGDGSRYPTFTFK